MVNILSDEALILTGVIRIVIAPAASGETELRKASERGVFRGKSAVAY